MEQELNRTVAIVGDLPAIPAIAQEVMAAVANAATSADDLRVILEKDPSLSARVLKVANSSLYAFRREVETLRHAISLLGFRAVETLVMAASLRDVFKNFGLSEKLLWEHSTLAGVVAGKLATYGAIDVDREQAFSGQDYFPDELGRHDFYAPTDRGFEREIAGRLETWRRLRREHGGG